MAYSLLLLLHSLTHQTFSIRVFPASSGFENWLKSPIPTNAQCQWLHPSSFAASSSSCLCSAVLCQAAMASGGLSFSSTGSNTISRMSYPAPNLNWLLAWLKTSNHFIFALWFLSFKYPDSYLTPFLQMWLLKLYFWKYLQAANLSRSCWL